MELKTFDNRRDLVLGGSQEETIQDCVEQWISVANASIAARGHFFVALSGGSTPKLIYKALAASQTRVDWSKVSLFWSDERAVGPTDPESNYHMAMKEGNLQSLPFVQENIFRMQAETAIEENALAYEQLIKQKLQGNPFDLIMLGMGEDGHTASLFPHTPALFVVNRLVVANHVPQKKTWRMTFTFECINAARHICIYALGQGKAEMVAKVLTAPFSPDDLPIQRVGTTQHKATYFLDKQAAHTLLATLP